MRINSAYLLSFVALTTCLYSCVSAADWRFDDGEEFASYNKGFAAYNPYAVVLKAGKYVVDTVFDSVTKFTYKAYKQGQNLASEQAKEAVKQFEDLKTKLNALKKQKSNEAAKVAADLLSEFKKMKGEAREFVGPYADRIKSELELIRIIQETENEEERNYCYEQYMNGIYNMLDNAEAQCAAKNDPNADVFSYARNAFYFVFRTSIQFIQTVLNYGIIYSSPMFVVSALIVLAASIITFAFGLVFKKVAFWIIRKIVALITGFVRFVFGVDEDFEVDLSQENLVEECATAPAEKVPAANSRLSSGLPRRALFGNGEVSENELMQEEDAEEGETSGQLDKSFRDVEVVFNNEETKTAKHDLETETGSAASAAIGLVSLAVASLAFLI